MTASSRYLDRVKEKLALPSDRQLALHFRVTRQRISEYRRGATAFSDERCLEIAKILGIDPARLIVEIQAERARRATKGTLADVLENLLARIAPYDGVKCRRNLTITPQ